MSIGHMDNFNIYGTTKALMTQGVYADVSGALQLVTDPDGVSPGHVARYGPTTGLYGYVAARYAFSGGAVAKAGAAWRQWMTNLPNEASQTVGWEFRGVGNERLFTVGFTPNGAIRAYVWQSGGNFDVVSYTDGVPRVTANGWWHIEASYEYNGDGTCDFEVRVEGVTVISESGEACRAIQPGQSGPGCAQSGGNAGLENAYCKNAVWWDGLGTSNNDFLGSVLVVELYPNADAALNWTPSTGASGWPILDNVPPNDAQYISAPTPAPSPYKADLTNLPADVTSVRALMSVVRAAKSDGGDGSLQVGLISNGDVDLGLDRPITTAQTYWRDVSEVSPDTGVAWTPLEVDAAQLQLNRTT